MDWIKKHFSLQNKAWKEDKSLFFGIVFANLLITALFAGALATWLLLLIASPISWSLLTVTVVLYSVGVYWGGGKDGD